MASCFGCGDKHGGNKLQKKPDPSVPRARDSSNIQHRSTQKPTYHVAPRLAANHHHHHTSTTHGPIPLDEEEFDSRDSTARTLPSSSRDADALVLELNSNDEWEWSGGHRLSAIEEIRSERSRRDSSSVHDILERYTEKEAPRLPPLNRDYEQLSRHLRSRPSFYEYTMSAARSPGRSPERSPERPRPIEAPPTDLESISRIDASLVFEHFTTEDAWLLGSALRARLLPISTPVVINISLANQNQTLFHTCTHSGVMPDNDSWVARKRKTVLRWGVSTWYMSCKFGGDERAFAEKYGLGAEAGTYAIHGGGIPIRVVGVEGVVAVVVVSGLKQHEDHAVIVECIKELYY